MCEIIFESVTDANRTECESMHVAIEQRSFIPDNRSSIELALKYPDACPLLVRIADGTSVGFVLYGIDEGTGEWKIFRLMVDERFQGLGYGRRILRSILERLQNEHQAKRVLVIYHEPNRAAARLYEREGFVEYARADGKVLTKIEWSE
jgi:diamine N-acetyltransferase